MKSTPFTLSTPKFQYFGLRTAQKITLLPDTMPQTMKLLSYDSGKTSAEIKICRIANEQYAKIEVFENTKGLQKEKDAFFTKGIDAMESFDCKTKIVTFSDADKQGKHIARKSFDFAAEI